MRRVRSPSGHELSVALSDEARQEGIRTDLRRGDSSVTEELAEQKAQARLQARRAEHGIPAP